MEQAQEDAKRNGETCRHDEELIALPYERKLRLYRMAFEENRKPKEGDKVVVVGSSGYSAFGRRRSHAHVLAAAMVAGIGSTLIR